MRRSAAFRTTVLVAFLLASCSDRRTLPVDSSLSADDRRALALVPDDALVVIRLDLAAVRRTSAWEAASAHPALPHDEVLERATRLDRIVVAFGPMVAAEGLLEPSAEGPFHRSTETSVPTIEPAPIEDAPSGAAEEALEDGDALEAEGIEGPDEAPPSPEELEAAMAAAAATSAGDGLGTEAEGYRRVFGDLVPGFVVVLDSSDGSTVCSDEAREASGARRRVGDFEVVEKDGLAWFSDASGNCGMTPSSMVDAVLRARSRLAPVVTRFVASNGGDLGFFGYAIEGGGSFIRSLLERTSSTLSVSERRFVDWLARVNEILQRGVVGSAAYASNHDGTVRFESVVDYSEPDRAAAHAIVADTARELLQVTGEALAGEALGSMPASIVEHLEIVREDRRVRYRWQVSEQTLTALIASLVSPDGSGDERSWLASMPDGFSFEPPPQTTGTATGRIEALEPQRAELETASDPNSRFALRALVDAYADRGRWDDARTLLGIARERSRSVDDPDELGELALVELAIARDRGEEASAIASLEEAIAACEEPIDCACLSELLAERASIDLHAGRLDAASSWLDRAESAGTDLADGARVLASRALVAGARGRPAEGRASLQPALDVIDFDETDRSIEARQILVLAMNELALDARVRLDERELEDAATVLARELGMDSSGDDLAAYARVAYEECRLRRRVPTSPEAADACESAVSTSIEAHGDVHPRVAAARLARAELLRARRETAEMQAELARSEAALAGMPDAHPLRARITALRGARRR